MAVGFSGLSVLSGKHAAGGEDVLSAGGADGTGDSVGVQPVAESLHYGGRAGNVWEVRDAVEPDEVHAAFEAS